MSILLDQVRIAGFRGLKNVEASLSKTTVFIGTNNSGKTSFIKALQLALGDYQRYVTNEDFLINESDEKTDQIIIDVRFVPVDNEGNRRPDFTSEWVEEFGPGIQQEPDAKQFYAYRTVVKADPIKGSFSVDRFTLVVWPDFTKWQDPPAGSKKATKRNDKIPFVSIDAQRDLHQELNEKTSFVGRVLSSVEYNAADVKSLEEKIADINTAAVDKSEPLKSLKSHLNALNQSLGGSGNAEVNPFPKKIRDLSKRFSVHFGDDEKHSFSMEYHGMGTRSWASMLSIRAFIELNAEKHKKEAKPYFPILAAEEPEAHLHPTAQKSLFTQLAETKGQVIISTHSPYLTSICDIYSVRSLAKIGGAKTCRSLVTGIDPDGIKSIKRAVLRNKGEVLFARALVLFEGVTEEQVYPAMFEKYFGKSPFALGVEMISVDGKNYAPFVKLALSFGIPVCIVGDNDNSAKADVEKQLAKIPIETGLKLDTKLFNLGFLGAGNDIEAELVDVVGLLPELRQALINLETNMNANPAHQAAKTAEINKLANPDLITRLRSSKAAYAGFLHDIILKNPESREKEKLAPVSLVEAFKKIESWLK
ncbi:AAA family ATPase [Ahrensia kielensis]|uniref:AAA family ATPase n=1 Tax=Ahrensia kielensis TaxID=76980 RepID=A0ABU9T524_9HYPH